MPTFLHRKVGPRRRAVLTKFSKRLAPPLGDIPLLPNGSRGLGRGTAICRGGVPAGGGTLFFLPAEAAGQTRLDGLLGAGDEHGVLGDIPGDGGPGGGVGAGPDGDGGDEIGIAAEESAIADGGAELSLPLKLAMATPQPKFTPLPQSVSPT